MRHAREDSRVGHRRWDVCGWNETLKRHSPPEVCPSSPRAWEGDTPSDMLPSSIPYTPLGNWGQGMGGHLRWNCLLPLPLPQSPSYVTLHLPPTLSGPWSPHLWNGWGVRAGLTSKTHSSPAGLRDPLAPIRLTLQEGLGWAAFPLIPSEI